MLNKKEKNTVHQMLLNIMKNYYICRYNSSSCMINFKKKKMKTENNKLKKNAAAALFFFKIALLMQNSWSAAIGPFRAGRAEHLILHQQSDFEFPDVILSQETSVFNKFHDFQIFDLMVQNLGLGQTFHSAYGSS